jgi:hypothetical protein
MLINADGAGANFVINSVATPTGSGGNTNSPSIKGVVTIDGALRENSQVVVMGRRLGQSEWQTWQTLTNMSTNDITWQYSGVTENEDYEVRAVLQVVGETVFTSDIREITAPSRSLNFKVRTNYFLLAPTVLPTINPCVQKADAWETYVVVPQVQNARQYWVQVGIGNFNSSGILYSQKHLASSGELSIRIGNLSTGIKNVLRYSYAVCQGCGANDNFSPWSKTVSFICN